MDQRPKYKTWNNCGLISTASFNAHGLCYRQRPHVSPASGLPSVALLVSESCAAAVTMLVCVVCAASWDHGVVQGQADAKGHFWVHGPTVPWVCVDVCGSCYNPHTDSWGLGLHLGPYWCMRAALLLGPCQSGLPVLPPEAMVMTFRLNWLNFALLNSKYLSL